MVELVQKWKLDVQKTPNPNILRQRSDIISNSNPLNSSRQKLKNEKVTSSSIFIAAREWRKLAEMSEKSKCQTVPPAIKESNSCNQDWWMEDRRRSVFLCIMDVLYLMQL